MRKQSGSTNKRKAGSTPRRIRRNANSKSQVAKLEGPAGLAMIESRSGPKPIRPSGWKPQKVIRGKLTLQVDWRHLDPKEKVKSRLEYQVTIASAHRLSKADFHHYENSRSFKKIMQDIEFEGVPRAHHFAVLQIRGHRPHVRLINFSQRRRRAAFTALLMPVADPEQEQFLLRIGERHPFVVETRAFLDFLGYFRNGQCDCHSDSLCDHMETALRLYQKVHRLKPCGHLTVETFLSMITPRCANPDFPKDRDAESGTGPTGTVKQDPIVFSPNRWDNYNLTYKFLTGSPDLSNEWDIIRSSMAVWGAMSPLTFAETTSDSSDLEFDFRRPGESGYPFDEGGSKSWNVFAHGFFPTNGLVEFDDHEDWGRSGFLKDVAVHEVGHALGLDHSSVGDATMYFQHHDGFDTLHEVDIRGIKSLYAPVYRNTSNFICYPLYTFDGRGGTDTVRIDLGASKRFLAWGSITMIDSLADYDRDNMAYIDIFEVDGNRTDWRVSGGDHFGSPNSPANVYQGAFIGTGQTVTFRLVAGHSSDLDVAGYALVVILS